jgi:hypothetical protein
MDPPKVLPAAGQVPRPQMKALAMSTAPSCSTIVKKRKRAGMHLVTVVVARA